MLGFKGVSIIGPCISLGCKFLCFTIIPCLVLLGVALGTNCSSLSEFQILFGHLRSVAVFTLLKCISGYQSLYVQWTIVVVFNLSTLVRTRERSVILYFIGSSLGDRILSPSWVRERLGLGARKDLRPILIFKVSHLLLLYCIKLVAAICAWMHH